MGKRGNIGVLLILVFLALGNAFLYFRKTVNGFSGLSVMSISEKIISLDFPTIIFIAQWVLIFAAALIFYINFLRQNKEEDKKEVSGVVINVKRGKSVTELDSLYELLKEKKTLKISVISKLFKISNEKALEWAKILENHDLGEIEYPAFSEPELVSK